MFRAIPLVLVFALAAISALAGTVEIAPSQDATMIEDPAGARANGSGPNLFAGRTSEAEGSIRRVLLEFDVAAQLPAGATVVDAALTLTMNQGSSAPDRVSLHRIDAAWGEGPSNSPGGIGAPAEPGDVTWIHTWFDSGFWGHPGGDVVASSASAVVEGPDDYTWSSTTMIHDVQRWLDDPASNHGWLLRGNEATGGTSKRFGAREQPDPSRRPRLAVTYVVPGEGDDEGDDEYADSGRYWQSFPDRAIPGSR